MQASERKNAMQKHRRMVLLVLLVLLSGMLPVAQPATPVAAAPVDEVGVDGTIAPQAASVPFSDGFEAPSLGADWSTQANNAGVAELRVHKRITSPTP